MDLRTVAVALVLGVVFVGTPACLPTGDRGAAPSPTFPWTPSPGPLPTPTSTPVSSLPPPPTVTPTPEAVARAPTPTPTFPPEPICPEAELEIEWALQGMISYRASGSVPLTVDLERTPPRVTGEAALPITGGGMGCTVSGDLRYRLDGEIVSGPDGEPQISLGGQRAVDVVVSCPGGGKGGGGGGWEGIGRRPIPYREGAVLQWTWSMAGSAGEATWTLHLRCGEEGEGR